MIVGYVHFTSLEPVMTLVSEWDSVRRVERKQMSTLSGANYDQAISRRQSPVIKAHGPYL